MTSKFLDIFSKRPEKIIKEPIKVTADYREKNSLVISELISLGADVEVKELKVADYIVNNVAIERKTVSDFVSSMINKRLVKQLEELEQYASKLLIIEGIDEKDLYNDEAEGVNGNAIRGFLLSIVLRHKVPIIFSKNSEDTAKFIFLLAKKKETEISLNAKKKSFNKKEQMQFILEGFPGIGPKTAKKILNEYKTLHAVFSAPLEELQELIGKKAEIFKILDEKY
ncbi:MAG: ERCC4 domain-containing protein [Nanoarchaeota archaeon]